MNVDTKIPLQDMPLPPFAFLEIEKEFETRFAQEVIRAFHREMTRDMPEENLQIYAHGRGWSLATTNGNSHESEFQLRSIPGVMSLTDVLAGDMAAIPRYIDEMAANFRTLNIQDFRATMQNVAEQNGNIVTFGNGKSAADAFIEMIQKVDFSVGPDGNVVLPTLFGGPPEFPNEVARALAENPVFKKRVDDLKAEKSSAALQREAERKARFKKAE